MAFLLRVASSQAGAEKLIDAKLLVRLGQCNYLSSSPQSLSPHQGKPIMNLIEIASLITHNTLQSSICSFHLRRKDTISYFFLHCNWSHVFSLV
jgi:hypothetical protein